MTITRKNPKPQRLACCNDCSKCKARNCDDAKIPVSKFFRDRVTEKTDVNILILNELKTLSKKLSNIESFLEIHWHSH